MVATRNSDKLSILLETHGPESLKVCDSRLPVKQVLFCFKANLEQMKRGDPTNQKKLHRPRTTLIVSKAL